jgi:hypothetical protein
MLLWGKRLLKRSKRHLLWSKDGRELRGSIGVHPVGVFGNVRLMVPPQSLIRTIQVWWGLGHEVARGILGPPELPEAPLRRVLRRKVVDIVRSISRRIARSIE